MKFKENCYVICNLLQKKKNNIIGIDNIMGFKLDDYVYDIINKKLYQIISKQVDINNVDDGIYAQILKFPFENSESVVYEEVFDGGYFSKYKRYYDECEINYRRNDSDAMYIDSSKPKCKIIKFPTSKF